MVMVVVMVVEVMVVGFGGLPRGQLSSCEPHPLTESPHVSSATITTVLSLNPAWPYPDLLAPS